MVNLRSNLFEYEGGALANHRAQQVGRLGKHETVLACVLVLERGGDVVEHCQLVIVA